MKAAETRHDTEEATTKSDQRIRQGCSVKLSPAPDKPPMGSCRLVPFTGLMHRSKPTRMNQVKSTRRAMRKLFAGDGNGQSEKTRGGAQEKLEAR
jgi:hypothetical protein